MHDGQEWDGICGHLASSLIFATHNFYFKNPNVHWIVHVIQKKQWRVKFCEVPAHKWYLGVSDENTLLFSEFMKVVFLLDSSIKLTE